jgi:ribosomal protein L11 methyltransferase
MSKTYLVLRAAVAPEAADALAGLAHSAGCLGIEELGEHKSRQEYRLYFTDTPESLAAAEPLKKLGADISFSRLANENWAEKWEQSLHPFKVTDTVWVFPLQTSMPLAPGETSLRITPKMTFGTGLHATTRLCAAMIEQEADGLGAFLDVGTGTGILAMLAAKYGARPVIACDHDPVCADNTPENFQANGMDHIRLVIGAADAFVTRASFNTIACNMISSQFGPFLNRLYAMLKPGGRLLLSGLLKAEQEEVKTAVRQAGFTVQRTVEEEEWAGLVCGK